MAITFDHSSDTITTDAGTLSFGDTGTLILQVGTSAERPSSPAGGMLRYNSDSITPEGYINGTWVPVASGATTASAQHPGISGSQYYGSPFGNTSTNSTFGLGGNILFAMPIYFSNGQAVTRVGCNVTTFRNNSNVRIGIYSNGSNGFPSALQLDSGNIATTSTGVKEAVISFTFDLNLYWIAIVCNANVFLTGYSTTVLPDWLLGRASPTGSSAGCVQASQTFGALPATFPTSITYSTSAPMLTLRNI
jgi:hypothetical protein